MTSKPLIFWGIDDRACVIVRQFFVSFKENICEKGIYELFEPGKENVLRDFSNSLATLRESARAQDMPSEPGLVLFSVAFSPEAETKLDILEEVSRILDNTLPGSQSIVLVSLLPPLSANDQEKIDSFKHFLRLEKIAWEVPFLNIIFVNQLSQALYLSENAEAIYDDAIYELLCRQLTDNDLDNVIRGIGYTAIANRNEVSGKKCCYSTAGSYKLIFCRSECIQHLETRFQYELFNEVLMDKSSILKSRNELKSIQSRADKFVLDQVKKLRPQVPEPDPVSRDSLGQMLDSGPMEEKTSVFKQEIRRITNKMRSQTGHVQLSLKEDIRWEFLDFSGESPGYLGGPRLYAEILLGKRYFSDGEENREQPSGISLFEKGICIDPFILSLEEVLAPYIEDVFSDFNLCTPTQDDEDSQCNRLIKYRDTIIPMMKDASPDKKIPVEFLFSLIESASRHLDGEFIDSQKAEELADEFIANLLNSSEQTKHYINANREKVKEITVEIGNLKKEYGFFQRNFTRRKEYNEKVEEKNQSIRDLDKELNLLKPAFRTVLKLFFRLFNDVILPHIGRAIFNQIFKAEIEKTTGGFYLFVSALEDALEKKWDAASEITEYSKPTAATVPDKTQLNKLYQEILDGRGLQDLAREALGFIPPDMPDCQIEKLSYHGCRNLRDYYLKYLEGSNALLDLLADYASHLFAPVREMNILDVIETTERGNAYQYLRNHIEKTRRFLDFSPGFIPLVENNGSMNTSLLVRTDQGIISRLTSDNYRTLFGPQMHFTDSDFIDNRKPCVIDMTCLTFGFPAFLMHALSEGRDLFHKAGEGAVDDLWPPEFQSEGQG